MSIFMHMEGIRGQTSDQGHTGWLDIISLDVGINRQVNAATSTRGDRESANAVITDLTLTRLMDSASPRLFIEACCGRGKTITFDLTQTGHGQGANTYLTYTLRNALVNGYKLEANAQDISRPLEVISLSFVDLEIRYTPYGADGTALAAIAVGFDTATNKKR